MSNERLEKLIKELVKFAKQTKYPYLTLSQIIEAMKREMGVQE